MTRNRVSPALVALAVLALVWTAAPATADVDPELGWRLRFSVAAIDFHSNLDSRSGYGIDIGGALAINGEYRFNRRFGLDLGAFGGSGVDVRGQRTWINWAEFDVYDTMSVSGLTAGVDIHLTPDSRVDLYICPMVALMQFGGLAFEAGPQRLRTAVEFDEDLAVGASLGLAVPLGELRKWSFSANLTHLESTLDGHDHGDLRIQEDYDVTMYGLGFGYRF